MKTLTLQDELKLVKKANNGLLRPIDVVNWASENPDSILYSKFEWDDPKAGHQYRLWQARHIINVQVTSIETKDTRMFVSVQSQRKLSDGGYHSVEDVLDDPGLYAEMLEEARRELNRLRRKYRSLVELKAIWNAIDEDNPDTAA
jgi:hypothetical protein